VLEGAYRSKEVFATGIFIGAQITGKKLWPVRECSAIVVTGSKLLQGLLVWFI